MSKACAGLPAERMHCRANLSCAWEIYDLAPSPIGWLLHRSDRVKASGPLNHSSASPLSLPFYTFVRPGRPPCACCLPLHLGCKLLNWSDGRRCLIFILIGDISGITMWLKLRASCFKLPSMQHKLVATWSVREAVLCVYLTENI